MGLYGWFSVFALIVGAQLHFGPGDTSRMFSVFGVISVIMQIFVVGRLTDKLGTRMMSNAGFAALILAFAWAPFMHNLWGAALLVATFSFGMSHVNATIPALLTDNAPANQRGSILGSAASLEAFSGVFMPPVSTGVLGVAGVAGPAAISASFVAIALGLGLRAQVAESRLAANATPAK
jgi:MFS family permease